MNDNNNKTYLTPLNICFVLTICTMFLPWFTYDASIMGYRFGWIFFSWFAVQFIIIGIYLSNQFHSKLLTLFASLSTMANIAAVVVAFGRWQEVCNIIGGWHWEDGFYTAQPGFWLSAALFILFFFLFHYDLLQNRK